MGRHLKKHPFTITGLVVVALVVWSSGANVRGEVVGGIDYQKLADNTQWAWPAMWADPLNCIGQSDDGYGLRMEVGAEHRGTIRYTITHGGKDVAAWDGFRGASFRVLDGVLYRADYFPGAEGGSIVCIDLANGRERWRSALVGLGGPIQHSTYINRIALEVNRDVVAIYGDESGGRYIEFKDCRTGKTLGNKVFARPPATRAVEGERRGAGRAGAGASSAPATRPAARVLGRE
jgi:hypothetical protein